MFVQRFIELLTPSQCLGCGRDGAELCRDCGLGMGYGPQRCVGCGVVSVDGAACYTCSERFALGGAAVALRYAGPVREAVLALKFQRLRSLVPELADQLMGVVPTRPFDVVTSVPIAPSRYRERGYNQSQLLARAVALRLGLPYRSALGRRTARHQLGLGRSDRLQSAQEAFYATAAWQGERVLVVDDVVTTGATLNACAAILRASGAAEVWALALARR